MLGRVLRRGVARPGIGDTAASGAASRLVLARRGKLNVAEAMARMEAIASIISLTKSMKSTAQAKLPFFEDLLPRTRPFTEMAERVSNSGIEHEEPQNISILVCASDNGLCGPMNVKLLRYLKLYNQEHRPKADCSFVVAGRQGRSRMGGGDRLRVSDAFRGLDKTVKRQGFSWDAVVEIMGALDKKEGCEAMEIWYNYFFTQSNMQPARRVIRTGSAWEKDLEATLGAYEWEGTQEEMADNLRELTLSALIHGSLCENAASEQASRVAAMGAASQNAEDIHADLKRESAKERQAGVTNELMDLVGGTKAVKAQEGIEE